MGDVRRTAVDVVDAGHAVLEDGLLESALLLDGALGDGEEAVRDVPRGAIDLREQVRLAELTVGGDDVRSVHGVAHPEIAGVLVDE